MPRRVLKQRSDRDLQRWRDAFAIALVVCLACGLSTRFLYRVSGTPICDMSEVEIRFLTRACAKVEPGMSDVISIERCVEWWAWANGYIDCGGIDE